MTPSRTRRTTASTARAGFVMTAVIVGAVPAIAQQSVTLADAMARARTATPMARVLAASAREAGEREVQARAGYFPRVDVTQSVERGDQPVFVFGSLLSQRRFTAANFDIAALNQPPATTNIRTAVTVEQNVFDGGRTRSERRRAGLARDLADLDRTRGGQDLAMAAADAFVRVLQLEAEVQAAAAAIAAANSDIDRSRARRQSGLVTDADVLALEVHLADARERHIAGVGDLAVARLALNDAIGLPLEQPVTLERPARRAGPADVAALTREAVETRIERQQADLRVRLAGDDRRLARAAFLPTLSVHGVWEWNAQRWSDQRSAWLIGTELRLNVFNGFADKARLAEVRQAELRSVAERDRVVGQIALDVRAAIARLEAARAREAAGRAARDQARESQRIIRDRYGAGLATVADVLRAAEASVEAERRATAAEMGVILGDLALERALGRL